MYRATGLVVDFIIIEMGRLVHFICVIGYFKRVVRVERELRDLEFGFLTGFTSSMTLTNGTL